ncbi:hypothetical protein LZ554_004771 [Drepanopeziza brunnea f. sp. 'monogermtubi']|nr:hypothetical protein LZ554_004771 [Drepanopeziza brunnea f. sp. 'monogermtubi']
MNTSWPPVPPPAGTQAQYGYQQAAPAYHAVQVRQSFAPPSHYVQQPPLAQRPIGSPQPEKKKVAWPPSVRLYVQRSFEQANLLDDVTRPEMEAKLKQTITEATEAGTLETMDWENLPLPQHLIRIDRAQASAISWQMESLDARMGGVGKANVHPTPTLSKKRKSQEMGGDDNSMPPWRNTNNRIEDRITQRNQPSQEEKLSKSQKNLEKRLRRFDGGYKSTYKPSPSPEPISGPVVGTCKILEKQYFRLTSAPIPSHVRPEPILRQTLDLLKKKWKKEGNYSYICDQFKSLRQDLTVQRIKNEFTVSVYEIHARIALEKGDIEKEEEAIKHALGVRSALALGNYHRFFRLYLDTPNMGAYLMDMFVVRERLMALSSICRSYKPDLKLRFITEELGFESDSDAASFICEYNGQHLLEEKNEELRFLAGKAGNIFEVAKSEAFRKVDIKGQI